MTKRLKMTLADGEWRPVKELLKRRFPYLPPSTAAKLILLELSEMTDAQPDTVTRGAFESPAVPDSHPESPQVTCPDPADAPVHDDMKKIEDLGSGSPELRIADLLEQLPWFGAKLAKSSSPPKFAAQLLAAFPGLPIEPELHKASAWLENNPQKRKSKLGSFLLSWMGNHGKGPQQGLFSGSPKESTAQVQARQQDYTPPKGWK